MNFEFRKKALFNPQIEYTFIVAHRGEYKNDFDLKIPENSIPNIEKAIRNDYDMIEMDVCRSKDGIFHLLHDSNLKSRTDGDGHTYEKTWQEMSKLTLRYNNKTVSDTTISLFEEVAKLIKNKILVKFHRKFDVQYFPELMNLIDKHNIKDQIIFWEHWDKNDEEHHARTKTFSLSPQCKNYNYIVSIENASEEAEIYELGNIIALEVHFKNINEEIISAEFINKVKKNNIRISVNTQAPRTIKDKVGGLTDAIALENPEKTWGVLLDLGITMFQTDYPKEFRQYLNQR